ncbi:cytochrome c [Pseudomonas sp. 5P_3.1_Bac2]|uniref:cytochrome c n=1 Tax=Pseudomonas sp. 5P_3.1_Bac2 TaxID=2971617 RepID=UPI0021CAB915|nr:cytochrome c [Pseudomonas sp. 5P_3.1_Bac2]MCU1718220.1 cytochrome c [Pseudomonas sp. 5P_3.1_Bac2]
MRALLLAALLPLSAMAADQALLERGQYLARAADCVACHSVEGGAEYAGGLPLQSPFGLIYGSNITPSKAHGIGNYSAEQFYQAVTQGKRADGSNLYPAMPYTSYRLLKRDDVDAIYAYLMSLAPVEKPSPVTQLSFPFNLRFGLSLWNSLYKDSIILPAVADNSATWQHGQYLVEALGHCGECHTPRNSFGALQADRHLQGGELLGYEAPSLQAKDLAARGWSQEDLATFLKHGISAQGSMFNEMYPVLHHSTQYLADKDHQAMATYLLGDVPPAIRKLAPVPLSQVDASGQRGRQHYLNLCAGCHGAQGEGVPHVAVAMRGNTTLSLPSGQNLLRVIDEGIAEQQFTGFERMQPMPGFRQQLDNGQLADLLSYLRQTWGGHGSLSAEQVSQLRRD